MALVNVLTRFAPFSRMGADSQQLLADGLVRKQAARREDLLHKGQPVSGAYLVLQGRLRVFTIASNGTEATLYFIAPGETCVLALNCLFNDLLYPAWVQAEQATEVAMIPGTIYRQLFETEPAIQNLTVQTLSTLVFRLMAELEDVHASHHKQRLANFVLTHAAADGQLQITQQQLAQHLGTTREVVARLMRDFVAHGLLATRRGQISICDLFGLRELVTATNSS